MSGRWGVSELVCFVWLVLVGFWSACSVSVFDTPSPVVCWMMFFFDVGVFIYLLYGVGNISFLFFSFCLLLLEYNLPLGTMRMM